MDRDVVSPPLALAGKRVVLLLQGGGALGAYQVGAFAALDAACRQANTAIAWVGGISIGAVNAAVIAGPASGDAGAELRKLWDEILAPPYPPYDFTRLWQSLPAPLRSGRLAPLAPKYADWAWAAFNPLGQRHFFGSRVSDPLQNPWLQQWLRPLDAGELAFYDTGPLRVTLDAHVDWNVVNAPGGTQLSLGATRVRDGETVFFNSFASVNPDYPQRVIRADDVLASGALPPGFPAIDVGGESYWDGGLSTNTPIEALAEDLTADATRDTIVFLIDLWDRKGALPQSLDDALWRQKSIAFGSRKEAAAAVVDAHELEVEAGRVAPTHLDVCQVLRERPRNDPQPQFAFADADFGRSTYEEQAALGQTDMARAIECPYRVPGVGGAYAALYRHGTYGKHRDTDGKFAAKRARQAERRSLAVGYVK